MTISPVFKQRFNLSVVLALSVLFSVVLIAYRCHFTSTLLYTFLCWNLILALIPYLLSSLIVLFPPQSKNNLMLYLLIGVWLLFFPNAPYILTDLFHLRAKPPVPFWYDLVLILSCAWNGLILAIVSLWDMHQLLNRLFNRTLGWIFALSALVLGSFGIYLGRYLRFNSWDIVSNPRSLFFDILDRIINPLSHTTTYGVTILFSVFLIILYLTIHQIRYLKND
jgi:uncharacterized membrane protein